VPSGWRGSVNQNVQPPGVDRARPNLAVNGAAYECEHHGREGGEKCTIDDGHWLMDSAVATTWEEACVFAHPLLDHRERQFLQALWGARAVETEQVPDLAVPERSGREAQVVHAARRIGR
jgi:hypothetical protein